MKTQNTTLDINILSEGKEAGHLFVLDEKNGRHYVSVIDITRTSSALLLYSDSHVLQWRTDTNCLIVKMFLGVDDVLYVVTDHGAIFSCTDGQPPVCKDNREDCEGSVTQTADGHFHTISRTEEDNTGSGGAFGMRLHEEKSPHNHRVHLFPLPDHFKDEDFAQPFITPNEAGGVTVLYQFEEKGSEKNTVLHTAFYRKTSPYAFPSVIYVSNILVNVNDMKIDTKGFVYVAGCVHRENKEVFAVSKLTPDGIPLWTTVMGAAPDSLAIGLELVTDGVVVVGKLEWTVGELDFGGVIAKISADGNVTQSLYHYPTNPHLNFLFSSVQVKQDGTLLILGYEQLADNHAVILATLQPEDIPSAHSRDWTTIRHDL